MYIFYLNVIYFHWLRTRTNCHKTVPRRQTNKEKKKITDNRHKERRRKRKATFVDQIFCW